MLSSLTIVSANAAGVDSLSYAAYKALFIEKKDGIILTTSRCPIAHELDLHSISYTVLDDFFESASGYDTLAQSAADYIFGDAFTGDCVLCVLGDPMCGETLAELLLAGAPDGVKVSVLPCCGDASGALAACGLCAPGGCLLLPCPRLTSVFQLNKRIVTVITSVYNRLSASDLKLILSQAYPEEHEVYYIHSGKTVKIPLFELDRQSSYSWSSAVVVEPADELTPPCDMDDLCKIMQLLRAPEGCPWDREQTSLSLRQYLLEEAHEAVQAITDGGVDEITEELGDVLLQVVFHAQIAAEHGEYTLTDILNAVCSKMILRHPHVFGGLKGVDSAEAVLANWEEIKRAEKHTESVSDSIEALPQSMETLLLAYKVQKKAAGAGMDFACADDALQSLCSEVRELNCADSAKREDEAGDVLFSLVNVLRHMDINPELALKGAIKKFSSRFYLAEKQYSDTHPGQKLKDASGQELDALWNEAKRIIP